MESVLRFDFISLYPTLTWRKISQVKSVLPIMNEKSLPVLIMTHKPFIIFSLL